MQHHRVEARERRLARRHAIAARSEHAAHFALGRLDARSIRSRRRARRRAVARQHPLAEPVPLDGRDQLALASGPHGYRRNYRDAKRALEGGAVELIAALRGHVAHVQGDDHRHPEALKP